MQAGIELSENAGKKASRKKCMGGEKKELFLLGHGKSMRRSGECGFIAGVSVRAGG